MSLKIYFCGSIRGGRQDADLYARIIKQLESYGKVLTEHVGHKDILTASDAGIVIVFVSLTCYMSMRLSFICNA